LAPNSVLKERTIVRQNRPCARESAFLEAHRNSLTAEKGRCPLQRKHAFWFHDPPAFWLAEGSCPVIGDDALDYKPPCRTYRCGSVGSRSRSSRPNSGHRYRCTPCLGCDRPWEKRAPERRLMPAWHISS